MLSKFYQKLQLIMTMMGIYDGLCDGVWGPKCIEAKRKWEMMDEFEPATPSNGLPFNGRGKLPKGMNYMHKGLDILWDKWDQARADEILKEKGQLITASMVHEHVLGSVAKAREEAQNEPVATVNTVPDAPLTSSILNTQAPAQEPEPEQEPELDIEEAESDEEQADSHDAPEKKEHNGQRNNRHPNWTKKR